MELTLAVAQALIDAGIAEADRLEKPMAIAVCDQGGHVVALVRMDDCMLLATETVMAKARTAAYFRRATAETVERSRIHPTVYTSFVQVVASPIVLSMGGVPLWLDGRLVGAVAAAGGSGEEDVQVATAAERRWLELVDD
jgi:glc operon protein GlcG